MNRRANLLMVAGVVALLSALIAGCSSSEESIQATVTAKIATAVAGVPTLAPTATVLPTATPQLTPTLQPLPTPQPAPTSQPPLTMFVLPTPAASEKYSQIEAYDFLIFRDGSATCSKDGATGVVACGPSASTIIQSAIDALDPILGGTIEFKCHQFTMSSDLKIGGGGVRLQGCSPGGRDPGPPHVSGTVLYGGGIVIDGKDSPGGYISNVVISNLGITRAAVAIYFKRNVVDSFVLDVKIEDPSLAGIKVGTADTSDMRPAWIYINNTNTTGGSEAAVYAVKVGELQIVNHNFLSSSGPGLRVDRGDVSVANSQFEFTTASHIIDFRAGELRLGNNRIGIHPATSCTTCDGINVSGGSYLVVVGNQIHGSKKMRHGINITSTAVQTAIGNNLITDTVEAPIWIVGQP